MSNPYIQFELDAAKKATTLASALRISLSTAMGGLARMWLHVYGADKADTVSAFYLRSFFEVDDANRVGEALVELGFVEQIEGSTTWRVRGAGRYTRITEVRREAGRRGAAKTNSRSAIAAANDHQAPAIAAAKPTNERQKSGKTAPDPASARQLPAPASPEAAGSRQLPRQNPSTGRQNAETPRQKTALDPRSEISLPSGEREISEIGRSPTRAHERRPPPDGVGAVLAERVREEPPQAPPPRILPGSPEWEANKAASKAAGWE